MNFEIGKTYNGYEILDVLKMSKTQVDYRVRNLQERRLEVLTVLPGNLQGDQEQMERFLREMKVHARLRHPNIIGFYTAMELERQAVMTTELVEGVTLKDRLEGGPLGSMEAAACIRQVLAALACAHGQQIIHRDITPSSIMITPEGMVKLSGFGLAKSANSPQLTQMGAVVGSLRYISPEQIKGSGALDPRSDLYSVGVVLYEAITGKTPFESASQFELMLAHVSQEPKAPSAMRPGIPEAMDRVVLKALAKDFAERYQTAQAFSVALEGVATPASEPAPAAAPVEAEPVKEPAAAPAEPRPEGSGLAVNPVVAAAEPVVAAPVAAEAVMAVAATEPVAVAATAAEPVAATATEQAAIAAPAPEPAATATPAVEQIAVAAPVPEKEVVAIPAAEEAVSAAPIVESAPPAMFQAVSSNRLETTSLMAICLGAAGVTVAVVLAYAFLGK